MQVVNDLRIWFKPIIGTTPWRVRRGWGSFVIADFGPRVRANGHQRGKWHLWIRDCEWTLESDKRTICNSESDQHLMDAALRNLESEPFQDVVFCSEDETTAFKFGSRLRLVCRPYSDRTEPDDRYWLFYLPDSQVISTGPDHPPFLQPSKSRAVDVASSKR